MTHLRALPSLTAVALAAAVLLSACGGGDAGPPAETVAPTLNITSSAAGTATGAVIFTLTVSEDVGSSLTADDIVVTSGTKGTMSQLGPLQYQLTVMPAPNATGTIGLSVAAGTYTDLVGNNGMAGAHSAAFDTRPPVISVASSAAGTTATSDVTFTFSFSKDVGTTFSADDVTVTGGTKGAFTRTSGTSATLVVAVPANNAGTLNVTVAAAAGADSAGTTNTAAATMAQAFNTAIPVVATKLVTFDEATAPKFTGFGGAEDATVVADPTNAANKVARIVKAAGAELWAGTTVSICPNDAIIKFPFAAGSTTLSARVWSPDSGIPVRLKIEDAADGTKSVETEAVTTAGGVWQTLNFNFANQVAGTAALNLATTYNKASVFFNFGKTGAQAGGAKTYYLDDLSFVGSTFAVACPGTGGGGANVNTISMDEATPPKFTGFGGAEDASIVADPQNAANKVARVIKSAGAELWAGTTFSTLANDALPTIALAAGNTTVTVRVLSPTANIPVRLKLENASDPTKTVETEATVTTAGAWQVLSFNFANPVAGTNPLNLATTFNKASIFFNFGKTGAESGGARTYHFEEVKFPAAAGGGTGGGSTTTLTFDEATAPKFTGFGGAEDAAVANDPQNAANKVGRVVKSAGAELWAGTTVSTLANDALPTIGFSAGNTTITVRVLSPDANVPVRLKVENAADGSKSVGPRRPSPPPTPGRH